MLPRLRYSSSRNLEWGRVTVGRLVHVVCVRTLPRTGILAALVSYKLLLKCSVISMHWYTSGFGRWRHQSQLTSLTNKVFSYYHAVAIED